jgi:hypothetical protein
MQEQKLKDFELYSGGANGADTFFGIIGKEYGIEKQYHYRASEDEDYSHLLKNAGIEATYLSDEDINECYAAIDKLFKKKHPRNHINDLKARNYFQALDSDGVFAIGKLNESKDGVSSGTNVAIQFGIKQKKPVYVYDYMLKKWFVYSRVEKIFVEYGDVPLLTQYFAGVGIRACQESAKAKYQYLGKSIENDVKSQIRKLYEKAILSEI